MRRTHLCPEPFGFSHATTMLALCGDHSGECSSIVGTYEGGRCGACLVVLDHLLCLDLVEVRQNSDFTEEPYVRWNHGVEKGGKIQGSIYRSTLVADPPGPRTIFTVPEGQSIPEAFHEAWLLRR